MKNKRSLLTSFLAGVLAIGGISLAFAASLVTAPVSALAASGLCSPAIGGANGGGAILAWAWMPPANGVPGEVTFTSVNGDTFSIGPYPTIVNSVDQNWTQIDDTAPILWGYKSGVVGGYQELFTSCQQWTLEAAQKMAAQGFSPTMVGGVMGPVIGPNGTVVPDPISSGGASTPNMKTITVNASPVNYYVGGNLATPPGGMFNNQGVVTVSDSFVYDQTTYVPIRFAAQLLGQPVAWNSSQYGVDITANSTTTPPATSTTVLQAPSRPDTMQITVNATPMHFYVGATDKTPPGAIFDNQGVKVLDGFVYDKTTYVPIRLAAGILNQTIQWDSKYYAVDIGTPPTSAAVGQSISPSATVASGSAPQYPPTVTNPPKGSAAHAARVVKRDGRLFAAAATERAPSKASPVRLIVEVLAAAAVVVGALLFVRWRREQAIYDLRRHM